MRPFVAVALGLIGICNAAAVSAQNSLTTAAPNWCAHEGSTVWEANRPAQNALARVTLDIDCVDDRVRTVAVKAETRCGRSLCSWSFAERAQAEGPALRALFFTYSATRLMSLHLSGEQISVVVENDYNQPGRLSDSAQAILTLAR